MPSAECNSELKNYIYKFLSSQRTRHSAFGTRHFLPSVREHKKPARALRDWVVLTFGESLSFQLGGNVIRHLLRLPLGYFERRRFQHAIALLESSPRTVKEIAFELGFSSLPHFSAWFRRRQGMPPRAFRANHPTAQPGHGKIP